MLQVLLRNQHALRTQSCRYASRTGLKNALTWSCSRSLSSTRIQRQDVLASLETEPAPDPSILKDTTISRSIPLTCPGCGAPSQNVEPSAAGFYGEKRQRPRDDRRKQEDAVFAAAFARGSFGALQPGDGRPVADRGTPICDRCHNLQYQSTGTSIIHPTTESIRSIIEESPHRRNHIYHVMDAADFPMSLIPNLTSALHLPRLRTQNRRSKSIRYIRDRVAEVNFIITRSDLLAPKKEQVDKLLPYIQEVLRDALGRSGKNVRLGNVRLVSAKRGWWTKTVKEEIYRRGGAGWMVGKVNVGKSALVEVVYPKGRMDDVSIGKLRAAAVAEAKAEGQAKQEDTVISPIASSDAPTKPYAGYDMEPTFEEADVPVNALADSIETSLYQPDHQADPTSIGTMTDQPGGQAEEVAADLATDQDDFVFDESEMSLLPPAQPEVAYPTMPIVSALPGTTASPIRLPFGKGKGELIDLPGIERSTIDTYVREESKKEMIMKHRIVPEQQSVKPGQSLLLGGLIRVTPKTDDLVFLMYGFLPAALKPHVTSTEKATAIQSGAYSTGEVYEGHAASNATAAAKLSVRSAGSFKLRWDVTKQRAGPVTDKVAGKQKASNLPYIVYALDLLIEGAGWVEIVAQVRRRKIEEASLRQTYDPFHDDATARNEDHLPEVEVFSPRGQFIGVRKPMNAWLLGGPKKTPVHKQKARPRHSMSYQRRVAGGRAGSARTAEPVG
ncbi:hypothetical protein AMS68_002672 [Peltaster fructicola]|uniref:Genetic interactor of prohibitins 3, mitochondrial n=1 Tax=Peltaster fructicola TaxID=286661 RepID=A0A6H0XR96_9PEZI|nr:hypothetical protein AMS68_002672 [Peltaster fructicola]